jgi:hypothetical protein
MSYFAVKDSLITIFFMCTISKETIRRACERTIANKAAEHTLIHRGDAIHLSVHYSGGEYHGHISAEKIREAYAKAWEANVRK